MKQIANVEIARLKAMANLLDTVPVEQFDLGTWVDHPEQPRKTILLGLIETQPACGFAGCAVGWADHAGIFPGLELNTMKVPGSKTDWWSKPVYNGYSGWGAVAELFGVTEDFAIFLFAETRYKVFATPAMVAQRIRKVVAKVEAIRARDRIRAAPTAPALKVIERVGEFA